MLLDTSRHPRRPRHGRRSRARRAVVALLTPVVAVLAVLGAAGPARAAGPTATFAVWASGLEVSVRLVSTTDPVGLGLTVCWSFGDETTTTGGGFTPGVVTCPSRQTGRTATHTYTKPGTYRVSVSVVDGIEQYGGSSRTVTVPVVPPVVARDSFTRTASSGWGTAELGGAWAVSGSPGRYLLTGGQGAQVLRSAGTTTSARLSALSRTSTDTTVSVSLDRRPTGGPVLVDVAGRRTTSSAYTARLLYAPNGTVQLQLVRGATVMAETVPAVAPAPGARLRVRIQVAWTSPTTFRVKSWPAGTSQPAYWDFEADDGTSGLQVAGTVGLGASLSGAVTNAPVTVRFDDLVVASP
jgi:trimeric autotransporter adhesin